jgi:hypothetical protein
VVLVLFSHRLEQLPKMVQKQVSAWIERAAEKMPEEEYAFKPDPAVRSFGQILGQRSRCELQLLLGWGFA